MAFRESIDATNRDRLSRRDLLRRGAAGAVEWRSRRASHFVRLRSGAATKKAATADDASDVDYTLRAMKKQAAPDGRSREIFCYNGELPGPVIRAKVGQKLRVRLKNELDVPTSVHWHGQHQPGTWQMDGVANVSRPPIATGRGIRLRVPGHARRHALVSFAHRRAVRRRAVRAADRRR